MVNRLESDGYLEKTRDTENRQRVKIYNTKSASNLLDIYHRSLQQAILGWLGGMTETDLYKLADALETVALNLEAELEEDKQAAPQHDQKRTNTLSSRLESLLLNIRNTLEANTYNFCREISGDVVVSRLQVRIIAHTNINPGISLVEVSEYLGVRNPTTSSAIKLLEREGLLKRKAADKGNKISLSTTKKAQKLLRALREQVFSIFGIAFSNLSPESSATILKALNCLYAAPSTNRTTATDKRIYKQDEQKGRFF